MPMGGLGGWGQGRPEWPGLGRGSRMTPRYSPSATANVLNIRGPVNTKQTWTGLEFARPIRGSKRKGKKSKGLFGFKDIDLI